MFTDEKRGREGKGREGKGREGKGREGSKIGVTRNQHPLCKQMIATYGSVIQQHRILCSTI